jgi:hypothetical protein
VHQFVEPRVWNEEHTDSVTSEFLLQLTSRAFMDDHPCLDSPLAEFAKNVQGEDSLASEAGGCMLCD